MESAILIHVSVINQVICLFWFNPAVFHLYCTGKRRSSRLNTGSVSEDNRECHVCHGFEDEVAEELLQCSKCTFVGQ